MKFIGTTYGLSSINCPSVLFFDTQLDGIDPVSIVDVDSASSILRKARAVFGSGNQLNTVRGKSGQNYYLTSFKYTALAASPTTVQSLLDHAKYIGTKLAGCTSTDAATLFTGSNASLPDSFIVPFKFDGTPTMYLPEVTGSSWSGAYSYSSNISTSTGHRLADGTSVYLSFSMSGSFGHTVASPSLGISRDTELVANGFGLASSNSSYVTARYVSGQGRAYLTGVSVPDEVVNPDFALCIMPDALYKFDKFDIQFEQDLVPGTRPKAIRFRTDIIEV